MKNLKNPKKYSPRVLVKSRLVYKEPFVFKAKVKNWLQFKPQKLAAIFMAVLLFTTYIGGLYTGLNTSKSYAEFVFDNAGLHLSQADFPTMLAVKPVVGSGQLPLKIDEENLFAMPLDQVEKVFEKRRLEMTEAMLDQRAEKIKNYLESKNSPFAEYSSTIARQPHWKLILAISFAESSWGKNCVDNNCSNIGVKPGHELWHEYKNYGEWIVDFNKLLERRYKDWSLDDMCGVYVKPCNKNWLMATKQVLDELKASDIE